MVRNLQVFNVRINYSLGVLIKMCEHNFDFTKNCLKSIAIYFYVHHILHYLTCIVFSVLALYNKSKFHNCNYSTNNINSLK